MSRGVNKVILIGNLGTKPEPRYAANGNPVLTLSIATSDGWRDKQTGELQERTEWHRVVLFNRLAEIAIQYLNKGSKVYIEGSLRTRKWQDQQSGQDRYTTEIVAQSLQMLDGRGGASEGAGMPQQGFSAPPPPPQMSSGTSATPAAAPEAPAATEAPAEFDDDVPF